MATCETCRFAKINWRKGDEYDNYALEAGKLIRPATSVQCRKNPPLMSPTSDRGDGWPWVSGDDWCGEYLATEEKA